MNPTFRIEELERVDSTNEECRRRAEAGALEGLVIRANEQTGGRGRRGRAWSSPPGNLYCSILLRPERSASEAAALGFAAVAALGDVVAALLPEERSIGHKWPNDLLIDGRKVSGLLLEAQGAPAGGLAWLVMGLGVNITSHPSGTRIGATDLVEMGAEPLAPAVLLRSFLAAFAPLLSAWAKAGFAAVVPAWMKRAIGIGQDIEIQLETERLRGRFHSLDGDGALVLESVSGVTRRITAGEVFFPSLQPAPAGR